MLSAYTSPTRGTPDCTFIPMFGTIPARNTGQQHRRFTMKPTHFRAFPFLVSFAAFFVVIPLHHSPTVWALGSGSGSTNGDSIEAQVRFDAPPKNDGCVWETVSGIDPLTVQNSDATTSQETLFFKACGNKIVGYQWIRTDAPTRVAETAASKVSRLVPTLLMRTSPPANRMVVGVGTWFWVPKLVWKPVSVTAWIQTPGGPVSVTTTATPNTLLYSPGNGSAPVSCTGPGREWTPSVGDSASTPCMYTYRSASHTQSVRTYNTKMSIRWKVTWRSSLGLRGTLPSITTGLPMKVRVLELQALSR